MAIKKHNLDNWTPVDSSNPLKSLAHEINDNLDVLQSQMLPGFKSARVDDGVPVQLDNIMVQLNTSSPRSLQFKTATGTLNVGISGVIYWCPGNYVGTYESRYWTGNALNTTWQQIFQWSFPWANDNAVYNVQDLTNGRFYRITLSIGPGYKGNFIVMERLV
jgi:hypothetical protein